MIMLDSLWTRLNMSNSKQAKSLLLGIRIDSNFKERMKKAANTKQLPLSSWARMILSEEILRQENSVA